MDFPSRTVKFQNMESGERYAAYIPSRWIEFLWVWICCRIQMNASKPHQHFPTFGNYITWDGWNILFSCKESEKYKFWILISVQIIYSKLIRHNRVRTKLTIYIDIWFCLPENHERESYNAKGLINYLQKYQNSLQACCQSCSRRKSKLDCYC